MHAGAKIVLAGMPERARRAMVAYEFLRKFYRQKNIRGAFDVVAMHPYGTNAGEAKLVLERTRDVLREVNDGRRPLWVTEIGWATEGQNSSFVVKDPPGQAEQLRKAFSMMIANEDRFRLGVVTWHAWRDIAPHSPSTEEWTDYTGLYYHEGNPKPACDSYVRFTGGQSPCQPIVVPPDTPTSSGLLSKGGDEIEAANAR